MERSDEFWVVDFEAAGGGEDDPPGGGEPQPPAWGDLRGTLPEDLREEPVIKNTKDLVGLAKQLVDSQKMLGNSIRIPGKDAGDEDRQKFYERLQEVPGVAKIPEEVKSLDDVKPVLQKLGAPEKPDDYQIQPPESLEVPDEFLGSLKGTLHEIGATQHQAQRFAEKVFEDLSARTEAVRAAVEGHREELRKTFGQKTDEVLQQSAAVLKELGGDELDAVLKQAGLDSHPAVVKAAAEIAKRLGESGITPPPGSGGSGALTPAEAQAQINEILNNKDHPYHNRRAAGHEDAVKKFLKLHEYLR